MSELQPSLRAKRRYSLFTSRLRWLWLLGILSVSLFPMDSLRWMFRIALAEWFDVSPLMVFRTVWIIPFQMSLLVTLMMSAWLYFAVCALAARVWLCRKEWKYTVEEKREAVVTIIWPPAAIIGVFVMEFGWFLYRYWSL